MRRGFALSLVLSYTWTVSALMLFTYRGVNIFAMNFQELSILFSQRFSKGVYKIRIPQG